MDAIRRMAFCMLLVALTCGAAFAQDAWTPVAQPDLKARLDAAPDLKVEEVCVSVKTTNRDKQAPCSGLWFVPNPDGETCDALLWYYPDYNGPHALVVFDLGTGETRVLPLAVPLRHSMHIGERAACGADGKL